MKVNPTKIDLLKEPFGVLIKDHLVNKDSVTEMLAHASKIVTVGDTTTEKLIGFDIIPDISVIDGKEKRVIKTTKLEYNVDKVLKFKNYPGELGEEIIFEVRKLVLQKGRQDDCNIFADNEKEKEKAIEEVEGTVRNEKGVNSVIRTDSGSSNTLSKDTGLSDSLIPQTKKITSSLEYDYCSRFNTTNTTNTTTKFEKIQIVVEGEEDIVALPFLIFAPVGWVVCYGQPNEGLVIVNITEESKMRAKLIFNKVFI